MPRVWIGNAITVATHFDPMLNVACVAAGRRRFTLFPPEQISNLYIGPLELTPAGAPVSLVSVTAPELDRYPRFEKALAAAQSRGAGTGRRDLHSLSLVASRRVAGTFQRARELLVGPGAGGLGKPFDQHLPRMLAFSALPEDQRRAWRADFDHYVFRLEGEPGAHLPAASQGLMAPMTPELSREMRKTLLATLSRSQQR